MEGFSSLKSPLRLISSTLIHYSEVEKEPPDRRLINRRVNNSSPDDDLLKVLLMNLNFPSSCGLTRDTKGAASTAEFTTVKRNRLAMRQAVPPPSAVQS